MRRLYKVKHNSTGKCLVDINYNYNWNQIPAIPFLVWLEDNDHRYFELSYINGVIDDVVCAGLSHELDDAVIETVEVIYKPVNDTNRLKNIVKRYEEKEIIRKLKS